MSTAEEKSQEVTVDQPDDTAPANSSQVSQDTEGASSGGGIVLAFLIGIAASLIVGWVIFPKLLYSRWEQPVDFNHALHVQEVDNGCASCHYFREDGTFSGIPKLANCLQCHEEPIGISKEEAHFYKTYVATRTEVPWHVYAQQPPCVFFSMPPMSAWATWRAPPAMVTSASLNISSPTSRTVSRATVGISGATISPASPGTPGKA